MLRLLKGNLTVTEMPLTLSTPQQGVHAPSGKMPFKCCVHILLGSTLRYKSALQQV